MSPVVAVRYLAEFAAEALRPWDPSREKAAEMLAELPLMVRLRRDDDATADEVTHLVLGRFAQAEPPAVPGRDFAPVPDGFCWCGNRLSRATGACPRYNCPPFDIATGQPVAADAAVIVAETVAEPTDWSRYGQCPTCLAPAGCCCRTTYLGVACHVAHQGRPLVEVVPQPSPAPAVWDDSVPPGGFVCSVCRTPVESEPCAQHGAEPSTEQVQP